MPDMIRHLAAEEVGGLGSCFHKNDGRLHRVVTES